MALVIVQTRPKSTPLPNGGRQVEWHIVMTDVSPVDEVVIDAANGFHAPCELVLTEGTLSPIGSAATIRMESGIAAGFVLASNDAIGQADVAAVNNRLSSDGDGNPIVIPARADKLVLRPAPNIATGVGGTITLDVTIRIPRR